MSGACLEKISFMEGEFEICRFKNSANFWYFRYYVRSGPNQKKPTYIKRTLRTDDRGVAERRAYEEWRKLKTKEAEGAHLTGRSVDQLIDEWLEKTRRRAETGEIKIITYRAKKTFFNNQLRNYFLAKSIKRVADLQVDTYDDFRYWRMTEGWKINKGPTPRKNLKPPTDGTINAEIGLIQEWYNAYLIPKEIVTRKPTVKRKTLDMDDLAANPPIPQDRWRKVYNYMDKWSKSNAKGVNRPAVHYWRMCCRHYILVAYNSGIRPTEGVGRIDPISKKLDRGLIWDDIEIVPQSHYSERQKKVVEDDPIAILNIRKTKTNVPRQVPCRAAVYLLRWKEFVDKWREDNGYPPVTANGLVFANPVTEAPYPYTMYSGAWSKIRDDLEEVFEEQYTLYSTRSSYVTNQLEEGVDVQDVCKMTGHSYRVMTRHYDRMQMRNRIPEVTKRRFGKRDLNPSSVTKLV